MHQAATQAVVVLLEYRFDHDRFPAALEVRVPAYLKTATVDVYSGEQLRYSVAADGEMLLYSVGRNLADDGGSAELVAEPDRPESKGPADIVYWPPMVD